MEIKMHDHNFRRMFFDILRDTNTAKYSMTKFAALVGLTLLTITIVMSLIVMWINRTIDHVLIVEILGFVLTLLGFKNSFGYKGGGQSIATNGNTDNVSQIITDENCETDPDAGKKLKVTAPKPKADFIDDSLKG
jgi:hypothetical protein